MKWTRLFIYSSGMILLVAAMERFAIAAGASPILVLPDPMLGIPLRHAALIVGGTELVVALICLFGKNTRLQIGWLAWLATNFFVFRIGLFWMHFHPQATWIGGLTDPLHILRGTTGLVMTAVPFYLLLGSYAAMVWFWSQGRVPQPIETAKMACHSCGVHIEFAVQYIGQRIPCPQCQATITLRRPKNLKMSCSFCREHIEFPSHALGQKIPCPHCKRSITLTEQT